MIARLRRRFVLIATVSVTLVLAMLMGVVNAVNFLRVDDNADAVLSLLIDNDGTFPEQRPHDAALLPDGTDPPPVLPGADDQRYRRGFTAETPYETRFFTVRLRANGALAQVNTGWIAAVSTEDAVDMAQTVYAEGSAGGYSGSFKYRVEPTDDGVLCVFLDCTRGLDSAWNFLGNSLLVSVCGIAAVFVLVLLLSRRAIRPVAESYEKQKQFITNAGHEIKTPLAIIDSCAEVIELEQGESKWTRGIRDEVGRLAALTRSLVSLARMDESGALQKTEFDLSEAVADTLAPFELLAANRGQSITTDIRPGIRTSGDEAALRQLCSILAENAVKYAPPDSELRFSLIQTGRRVTLASENRAEGLSPGAHPELFDRFYRRDPARTGGEASGREASGGYGIGLAMARSIVEAHGGRIDARAAGDTLRISATW